MADPTTAIRDERVRSVLRAAVETYIDSASPVASRTLNRTILPISSAAIRAVMAGLESSGHLVKPHTSGGRIPTVLGYRAYVDQLLALADVPEDRRARVQAVLEHDTETRRLMRACVLALVDSSELTGFAVSAPTQRARHRHVELVRLRPKEALAIFCTLTGTVHHHHIVSDVDTAQSELDRIQNFLNARFEGLTFDGMRQLVDDEAEQTTRCYSTLAARAFALVGRALREGEEDELDVVVAGHHHLLACPEFADGALAGPVLESLERRETWRELLDKTLSESGVTVLIGEESENDGLQDCTVVAAAVPWERGVEGAVGLVGPTRLAYGAAISLIAYVRRYILAAWARRYPA